MDLAWAVTPRPIVIHIIPSMLPYSIGIQLETVNGCGHGLGTVSWIEIIIVVLYLIPPFYHAPLSFRKYVLPLMVSQLLLTMAPSGPPSLGFR